MEEITKLFFEMNNLIVSANLIHSSNRPDSAWDWHACESRINAIGGLLLKMPDDPAARYVVRCAAPAVEQLGFALGRMLRLARDKGFVVS